MKNKQKHGATHIKDAETVIHDDVESTDSEYATTCEDVDEDTNVSHNDGMCNRHIMNVLKVPSEDM